MSVKYHVIGRVDPRDSTLPKTFYAQIKNGDEVKFDDLVNLVSQFSTVNYGDIYGVIHTLLHVIPHELNYGRTISLGKLGKLFMTIKSKGKPSEKAFINSDIQYARIRFRPGVMFKKMLKTLDFEKVAPPGNA